METLYSVGGRVHQPGIPETILFTWEGEASLLNLPNHNAGAIFANFKKTNSTSVPKLHGTA